MTIKKRFIELCEENDLEPGDATLAMEALSDMMQNLRKLSEVDSEEAFKVSAISSELGEILGFSVDEQRIDSKFKEELEREFIQLSEELSDELDRIEGELDG